MPQPFRVFNVEQSVGMFGCLGYCLLLARACEEQGLEPYVTVTSSFYVSPGRGNDWFSYFFGHRRLQLSAHDVAALARDGQVLSIRKRSDINRFARGAEDQEISNDVTQFSEAARLFGKYFVVHKHVLDRVGAFVDAHFDRDGQLGIHFRGTDHYTERDGVPYADVTDAATKYFPLLRSVFIATDEQEFLTYARSHLPARKIITFAQTASVFHKADQGDNYDKAFHALADCLLLSRCRALVKTPSALSAWSKVFGADMDVVLVGKPYPDPWRFRNPWSSLKGLGYFPETHLYRWETDEMRRNRVIAILAEPPAVLDEGRA
jgi:hypothetical protein